MLKNILLNRINRMGKSHVSSLILCNYIKKEGYRTKRVDGLIPFNKRSVIIM